MLPPSPLHHSPAFMHRLLLLLALAWILPAAAQPTLVADLNTSVNSGNPSDLVSYDGKLYFAADRPNAGRTLSVYDPATGATTTVRDASGELVGLNPSGMAVIDGNLFFSGASPDGLGRTNFGAHLYDSATGTVTLLSNTNALRIGRGTDYPQPVALRRQTVLPLGDHGGSSVGPRTVRLRPGDGTGDARRRRRTRTG